MTRLRSIRAAYMWDAGYLVTLSSEYEWAPYAEQTCCHRLVLTTQEIHTLIAQNRCPPAQSSSMSCSLLTSRMDSIYSMLLDVAYVHSVQEA